MIDDNVLGKLIIGAVDASQLNALDEDNRYRLQCSVFKYIENHQKELDEYLFHINVYVEIEEPITFVIKVVLENKETGSLKVTQFKVLGDE